MTRRALLAGLLMAGTAWLRPGAGTDTARDLPRRAAEWERRYGGRLGVAVLDTGRPGVIAYRGEERFPLCSTHKFLTAAFVLARVDRGQESLSRRIAYTAADLVAPSPFTAPHAGGEGLTVGSLCAAALTVSDNTAANLLLDTFGGPAALTAYLRSLGDERTRLDRREPALNDSAAGDPRDTTTPLAMLQDIHRIVLGDVLSRASREQLTAWLVACKTGDRRLRAGVPRGWRVGDKTGTGIRNATNDVAVIWPPRRAPLIVTAYSLGARAAGPAREAILADVGKLAARL